MLYNAVACLFWFCLWRWKKLQFSIHLKWSKKTCNLVAVLAKSILTTIMISTLSKIILAIIMQSYFHSINVLLLYKWGLLRMKWRGADVSACHHAHATGCLYLSDYTSISLLCDYHIHHLSSTVQSKVSNERFRICFFSLDALLLVRPSCSGVSVLTLYEFPHW